MTMDYENENNRDYDEDGRDAYRRDERSMSPRGRREDSSPRRDRVRSASPGGRGGERSVPPESRPDDRRPMDAASTSSERGERRGPSSSDGSQNPGTNLFVTGIHPRLTEDDVTRLFAKYGEVEKCQIMLDPHTKESRGFGFVKLATLEQADSAKERLQGEVFEGRTLSIEKARRSRPRTPTPGKYFGPPKRANGKDADDYRRGPPGREEGGYRGGRGPSRGGRFYDDYDRGYNPRYDDRDRGGRGDRYYSSRDRGDDYPPRGVDRYASGRDDRYSGRDERRAPRDTGYASYSDRDAGYSRSSAGEPAVPAATGSEGGRAYGGGAYRDEARGDDRSYRR
ncbi:RNA-binding domain-containing protein [Choiromyces venosus 120613-1]|uniref:RNA-binding domain-containing protein n=1 Tax=Choiromyces venosus 120613-1 TaxID=1336337 RepID=A0A3N4K2D5_9PEZI|nr:RNA-binding domain-containing protein [Choiromyces venosus 120613-1]